MKPEEAVDYINKTVKAKLGKSLDHKQKLIIEGTWNNESYQDISEKSKPKVNINTLMRDSGPKLWDLLSIVFDNTIAKKNLVEVVTSYKELEENNQLSTRTSDRPTVYSSQNGTQADTLTQVNFHDDEKFKQIISQTLTTIMKKEMEELSQSLEKKVDQRLQKIEHQLNALVPTINKLSLKVKENDIRLQSAKTLPQTKTIVDGLIKSILKSQDENEQDNYWQKLKEIALRDNEAVINGLYNLVNSNCQNETIIRKIIENVVEYGLGIKNSIQILHKLIDSPDYTPETRLQAILGLQQIAPEDEKLSQAISHPDIYPLIFKKL